MHEITRVDNTHMLRVVQVQREARRPDVRHTPGPAQKSAEAGHSTDLSAGPYRVEYTGGKYSERRADRM
jgi:hypothetical protein